jgi:hypothetical protein
MAKRRREGGSEAEPLGGAQGRFAWTDPARVLEAAPAGEVVFEAPELKPRPRRAAAPRSLGLPFGVREVDGQPACWSCGRVIDDVVRAGPGDSRCPGCGAKLPFVP